MRMLRCLFLFFFVLVPRAADAAGLCVTRPLTVSGAAAFDNIDVSGGTVTSDIFPVSTGANITLRLLLVDAGNGVSNIRLTFREYQTYPGSPQAYTVPDCDKAAGIWTCNQLKVDWNPQTAGNGKAYAMPVPIAYRYMDFTATLTGAGAGDTLDASVEVCY